MSGEYSEGYDDGHSEGYEEGHEQGYKLGFKEGKAAAIKLSEEKLDSYLTQKLKQAISDFFYDIGPEN